MKNFVVKFFTSLTYTSTNHSLLETEMPIALNRLQL